MADVFFSYSSKDRERVRPVRDALAAQGFDIFWDQEVPAGIDWDSWIRQHLNQSKCAVVFWSIHSVDSDNVRHEATVAKQHGKLIPVMLDLITAEQFPMGLYVVQSANLSAWIGDVADSEWLKLQREIATKLTPMWVRRMTDTLEAELLAERTRREAAERRDKTLREQIAKEAQTQQELRQERDAAFDEIETLHARLKVLAQDHKKPNEGAAELAKQYASAQQKIAALEQRISQLAAARDQTSTGVRDGTADARPVDDTTDGRQSIAAASKVSARKRATVTLSTEHPRTPTADDSGGKRRAVVFAVTAPVACGLLGLLIGRSGLMLALVGSLSAAPFVAGSRRGRLSPAEITYYCLGLGLTAAATLAAFAFATIGN
jgi:TIR domain